MAEFRKAMFPVADFCNHFWPATMTIPRELLPIINKPLIQYATEEAINAGIDIPIFVTGWNKTAIKDHFDSNNELVTLLHTEGNDSQANLVLNIIPTGVECIFVGEAEQLGLGHEILYAERTVGSDPFAVLLADDFPTDYQAGVTADLVRAFSISGKSQLSVMEVDGANTSKYGVVILNDVGASIEVSSCK